MTTVPSAAAPVAPALRRREPYGTRGRHKGSLQANFTVPIQSETFLNFATYFLVQYWTGYGESLRDYNKSTNMVRAGFSLVR